MDSTSEISEDTTTVNEATSSVTTDPSQDISDVDCDNGDNAISSTTPDKFTETIDTMSDMLAMEEASLGTEPDLFENELNSSNISGEKSNENVDDIVQDLENLLGESDEFMSSRESLSKAGSSKVVENTLCEEEANLSEVLSVPFKKNDESDSVSISVAENESSAVVVYEDEELPPLVDDESDNSAAVDEVQPQMEVEEVQSSTQSDEKEAEIEADDAGLVPVIQNESEVQEVSHLNVGSESVETVSPSGGSKAQDVCNIVESSTAEFSIDAASEAHIENLVQQPETVSEVISSSSDVHIEPERDIGEDNSVEVVEPQVVLIPEDVEPVPEVISVPDVTETLPIPEVPEAHPSLEVTTSVSIPEATAAEPISEVLEAALTSEVTVAETIPEVPETMSFPEVSGAESIPEEVPEEMLIMEVNEAETMPEVNEAESMPEVNEAESMAEVNEAESMADAIETTAIPEEEEEETSVELAPVSEITAADAMSELIAAAAAAELYSAASPEELNEADSVAELNEAAAELNSAAEISELNAAAEASELNAAAEASELNAAAEASELQSAAEASELHAAAKASELTAAAEASELNAAAEVAELNAAAAASELNAAAQASELTSAAEVLELNAAAEAAERSAAAAALELIDTDAITSTVTEECSLKDEQPSRQEELNQPLTVQVEDADSRQSKEEASVVTESESDPSSVDQSDSSDTNRAPLIMTISKHKFNNTHSILKIYDPAEPDEEDADVPKQREEPVVPKITIKPVINPNEAQHSPRLNIKPVINPNEAQHSPRLTIKPVKSPDCTEKPKPSGSASPRITIKPGSPRKLTIKPYTKDKLNIKPIVKPEEQTFHHSPKITIKPIIKPDEIEPEERHSPRIIIKPIIKPQDVIEEEQRHSPKITIKPIVKPPHLDSETVLKPDETHYVSPRIIFKPIKPQEDSSKSDEIHSPRLLMKPIMNLQDEPKPAETVHSPRITIKPLVKPPQEEVHSPRLLMKPIMNLQDEPKSAETVHSPRITIKPIVKPPQEEVEEMAVQPLKLTIKPIVKPPEIVSKITIKPVQKPEEQPELIDFEDQIKQERIVLKIPKNKKEKTSPSTTSSDLEKLQKIKLKFSTEGGMTHIVPVNQGVKRIAGEESESPPKHFKDDLSFSLADVVPSQIAPEDIKQEVVVKEECLELPIKEDPDIQSQIPVFEIKAEPEVLMVPAPRKRGRPRKVPLVVREEFKDPKDLESPSDTTSEDSNRPKRSCRGATARTTLGLKPRKPRGPSTRGGRGGKRNVNNRQANKRGKERKSYGSSKKDLADFLLKDPTFDPRNGDFKSTSSDPALYEEETRMSADNSSRAHTPAKQVYGPPGEFEESQSSIQSNTTTESGEKLQKARRSGTRLEVHQEPEGEVISADKLAEYSWGGGGPYMLQEQVAQFLGIKSFKRKYPGIHRRPVDMQERDFIRESCLASEAMCDMGLTAVKSEDILDIMYTDFQHKYEEYCKHQRDRQAKDVSNKQKALSLAASQEKNKLNIVEQAIQSASQWNASFNKTRREERKACMDLQTFTVHYPKGKMKQVNKLPVGNYPLALVPGQFTDYFNAYTPDQLNELPLNSVGTKKVVCGYQDTEESQSDDSGSDSDSSSSDSDSSCSGSSDAENCKKCAPLPPSGTSKKLLVR